MEALRLKATASEGKLTVAVPETFDNQELEVIILMHPKEKEETLSELHKKRMEIFGKAKYPDFPITKYDAYNQ